MSYRPRKWKRIKELSDMYYTTDERDRWLCLELYLAHKMSASDMRTPEAWASWYHETYGRAGAASESD